MSEVPLYCQIQLIERSDLTVLSHSKPEQSAHPTTFALGAQLILTLGWAAKVKDLLRPESKSTQSQDYLCFKSKPGLRR